LLTVKKEERQSDEDDNDKSGSEEEDEKSKSGVLMQNILKSMQLRFSLSQS
jgi:hypothetical protein